MNIDEKIEFVEEIYKEIKKMNPNDEIILYFKHYLEYLVETHIEEYIEESRVKNESP